MRMQYDKKADAAYIYLQYPIKEGESKNTVELKDNIFLDFDKNGKLLGVEILCASKILTRQAILHAQTAYAPQRTISHTALSQ